MLKIILSEQHRCIDLARDYTPEKQTISLQLSHQRDRIRNYTS